MELKDKTIAFVVAHPAHLLTVIGMVMRFKPKILTLTKTDTGAGAIQGEMIERTLEKIDLTDSLVSLRIDEDETYRQLLAGNHDELLKWPGRIESWLSDAAPDVVFGDAYETSNVQHDIGSLMLDEALSSCRGKGMEISRCEIPLFNCPDGEGEECYGVFAHGSFEEFRLNDPELSAKIEIVDWAKDIDPQIKLLAPLFQRPEIEIYREVSIVHDYTKPPTGLQLFYDLHGARQVQSGKYTEVVTFENHFLPLVRKIKSSRPNAS